VTEIRAALALLTRLPIPARVAGSSAGVAAFGIVGLLLGAAAALPVLALPGAPLVGAVLAVAILAILTGALHLDGLADTADALAAPDPGRAEVARKDPRIGAAGAVAVVLVVLLDVAAIAAISDRAGPVTAGLAVVTASALARGLVPVVARLAGVRVRPDGAGHWFAAASTRPATAAAVAVALAAAGVAAALAASPPILVGTAGAVALVPAVGAWLRARRGALDGDLLGAVVELGAAVMLVTTLAAIGAGP
jgi:adenosylcobinamide-GDP ribazoletransferase